MSSPGSVSFRQRFTVKEFDRADILKGIVAFVVQLFVMTSGALLINNQIELSKCNKNDNKSLNFFCGSLLVVSASLMVLYSIFLLVKPKT
jgi:surface polysaccharide O-acyltransferase-like enzyme